MASPLLDNIYPHPLTWNTARDEEDASLVSAYGVSAIGKVCKFDINTHVHLAVIARPVVSRMSITSFHLYVYNIIGCFG